MTRPGTCPKSESTDYWMPERYYELLEEVDVDTAASADGVFDFGPSERAALPDVQCTDWTVDKIASGALDAGGVVLALGLARPHLPTLVGQKWFDRYPERVEVPAGLPARVHDARGEHPGPG